MRTDFVLIDSENVKPEYIERLKHERFRVIVFVGAHHKRIDFEIVDAVQSLGSNGSYVQISGQGPNALDFHIAYYIGKLSAADPEAYFHIISKDKGFEPLIKHLRNQKVFCFRWASVLEIPPIEATDKPTATEWAAQFYQKRILSNRARPATVKSLQSTINSHFNKDLSAEEVAKVLQALTAAGHIVVNGNKVLYPAGDAQKIGSGAASNLRSAAKKRR